MDTTDRTGQRVTVDGRDGFTILRQYGDTMVVVHDSVAHLPGREGNVTADRVAEAYAELTALAAS